MTCGDVAPIGLEQPEALLDAREQVAGRHQLAPAGGELDGERQPVELLDERGELVLTPRSALGALLEQRACRRRVERPELLAMLPGDSEGFSRRHEEAERRARLETDGDQRRRRCHDAVGVVEHHEQRRSTRRRDNRSGEPPSERLDGGPSTRRGCSEPRGTRHRLHEHRLATRVAELAENDVGRASIREAPAHLASDTRLADASGAGQRHDTRPVAQQRLHGCARPVATEQKLR